jgi:hypothetical protein
MKSNSKQHYDNFEFFPLYGAGFGQQIAATVKE